MASVAVDRSYTAYRGKRGKDAPGVSSKFAEAFERYHRSKGLKRMRSGRASWHSDPFAYLCGYTPNEDQQKCLDLLVTEDNGVSEVGFSGAPGAGKTWAALQACLYYMIKYPGYQVLWCRQRKNAIHDSALTKFKVMLEKLAEKHGLQHRWETGNELSLSLFTDVERGRISRITFRQGADTSAFQGGDFDAVVVDEAPEVSRASYLELQKRCRGSANNPPGPGGMYKAWKVWFLWMGNQKSGFLYREFVARHERGELNGEGKWPYRRVVIGRLQSNLHNLDRGYLDRLRGSAGAGQDIDSVLAGEHNFDGKYVFPNIPEQVFEPFDPEKVTGLPMDRIPWIVGFDPGWHMCAIVHFFVHNDVAWVYESFVRPHVSIEHQARQMRKHPPRVIWAGREVTFNAMKRGQRTVYEEFASLGIILQVSNESATLMDVDAGATTVRGMLQRVAVRVHPRCVDLVSSLRDWQYEVNGDDEVIPGKFSEESKDACDALRYGLIRESHRIGIGMRRELAAEIRGQVQAPRAMSASEIRLANVPWPRLSERQRRNSPPGAWGPPRRDFCAVAPVARTF